MEKVLKLYTYVDGVNDTPFPSEEGQIEISAFRYDAKRMGGAPVISATVMYPTCLDSLWTDEVYASFGGERYFLKQTPTSSFSNEDSRYSHQVDLLSERVILDNVYFFDVVSEENEEDGMVANGSEFSFFGDIHEFARRLALSLSYSNVGYNVVVDEGVTSDGVLFSFSNAFFSNAIQESYNLLEIPYYFEGKTLHFGGSSNTIQETFSYGVDNSLLSITKENANYKIVNRATAMGSSDNIPFYYPNKSPLGDLSLISNSGSASFRIKDFSTLSNSLKIGDTIVFGWGSTSGGDMYSSGDGVNFDPYNEGNISINLTNQAPMSYWFKLEFYVNSRGHIKVGGNVTIDNSDVRSLGAFLSYSKLYDLSGDELSSYIVGDEVSCGLLEVGSYSLLLGFSFPYLGRNGYSASVVLTASSDPSWTYQDSGEQISSLESLGIEMVQGEVHGGDTITLKLDRYIKPSPNLLPSKYRESDGKERFYNATNNTYTDESGNDIVFEFPYLGNNPREHIFSVDHIKPTIEGMTNAQGLRVDMFSAFAYDEGDNDETYEDSEGSTNYKHPYFFAKLRKLDFNLFDHAIEGQPMRFAFTSGDCGACEFEIGVDEETQKNTVQVDSNGDLIRDEEGRVLCGVEGTSQGDVDILPQQNDTINNEVWIALRKEESTYGVIMPNASGNLRPKACTSETSNDGDTFVILGISLPQEYILSAEEKLEQEIIQYLQDNNLEKFNFSVVFSRIFFEENPSILASLSENSRIKVSYNGEVFEQYISSYSYTMGEGDVLPEIRVELSESLSVSQNAMQNAVNEVKATMGRRLYALQEEVLLAKQNYVSKQADDSAFGVVDFTKGIKFGEGGKVEILENNSAKLTIEYLDVTKKATFNSIEIQEKKHVGGQILVTNASIIVGEVEEFLDYYRCYFQTKGEDDKQVIFNTFAVGDQAICQTFNAWGTRYYWRLVVGVGEDYIDLSKSDYDSGSMTPIEGDRVIQLGNRSDSARQNAIVIAAYGEEAPYIIQYKGINSYDLPQTSEDERIMTKLSPTENILTGLVRMTAGSSGLEMFEEWASKQELIDSKASGEDFDAFKEVVEGDIENIKKQVDGAITTWFFDPVPTLDNAPANEWTTKELKDLHLGDLYYSGGGKAYRFQYDNSTSTYYWNPISDEDITKALENAKKAQDTADGKRRVFVVQPTPPYDKGDLWSRGSTLPMMVCVNAKGSGTSYAESDWDYADNNAELSTKIAGFDYIKRALKEDTTILGGLIQSSILSLGYTDSEGVYRIMSGTNGVYDPTKTGGGIASWWGGEMGENSAKALVRFDGSGFLANKNITWDENGYGNIGGGLFSWGEDESGKKYIRISNEVVLGGNDSVASILTSLANTDNRLTTIEGDLETMGEKVEANEGNISQNAAGIAKNASDIKGLSSRISNVSEIWNYVPDDIQEGDVFALEGDLNNKLNKSIWDSVFEIDEEGNLKAKVGLYSTSFISSRESDPNAGSGGGGAASALYTWNLVKAMTAEESGVAPTAYALKEAYSELNTKIDNISVPSLSGYATEAWVLNKGYITSDALPTKTSDLTNDSGFITSSAIPTSYAWSAITGKPTFATVATSGSYNDLSNKPTIPSIAGLASETWVTNNFLGLGGGILHGPLEIHTGGDIKLVINNTDSETNYSFVSFRQNGVEYGSLGTAWDNNLTWNRNTLIHSGNIGSYNAGSATKLQTARTIWGQSFDGTGNVSGDLNAGYNKITFGTEASAYHIGWGDGDMFVYTNYYGHYFTTLGAERMRIAQNGNVLIGTTIDNGAKLQVGGNLYLKTVDGGIVIEDTNSNTYATTDGYIKFNNGYATVAEIKLKNNELSLNAGAIAINNTMRLLVPTSTNGVSIAKFLVYESSPYGIITRGYTSGVHSIQVQRESNDSEVFGLSLQPIGGNVGIGTTSPACKLDVNGNARFQRVYIGNSSIALNRNSDMGGRFDTSYNGWQFHSDGNNMAVYTEGQGDGIKTRWYYDGTLEQYGTIHSTTGIWTEGYVSGRGQDSSSDRRLKENIAPLRNALNYVLGTNYVSFDWKDTREKSIGIIAQEEIGREFECLVQKNNEHYSYLYGQHTALIGAALKEEDKKVEELKTQIQDRDLVVKELKAEILFLKAKINGLETRLNS